MYTKTEIVDTLRFLKARETTKGFNMLADCAYLFQGANDLLKSTYQQLEKKYKIKKSTIVTGITKSTAGIVKNNNRSFLNTYFGGIPVSGNIPLKKLIKGIYRLIDEQYFYEKHWQT